MTQEGVSPERRVAVCGEHRLGGPVRRLPVNEPTSLGLPLESRLL
jgi:hypothetical protein